MVSLSKQQLTILGLASSLYFILVIVRVNTTSLMWRYLIIGSVFIIAAIIDLFTYTLPDILTLGGALLGFLLPGNDVISSIKGSLAGLVIMSFIAAVSRGGMGGGDVKLALTMGSFLGWPLVLPALGLSFLLGGSFGLILLMTKVKDRTDSIPFGPFLTLGTLIVSLWGQELIQCYLETTINKKRAGYVLIELLMVAAIITLITGGIMYQGVKWIDSIRLRQSSRELTSTLRLLQNQAITEERTIYFRFVLRENNRWGYIVKQTDEYGYFEPGEIYRPLPPGVKLDYFSAGLPELMLHATGAPSTGTTIRLSNSWGRSVEITILPATGRIQVKKETAN